MKTPITVATLVISLFAIRLTAADTPPMIGTVEKQFQQADVQLAIEQYKKLRMAAFDLSMKLDIEGVQTDDQRKQLAMMRAQLEARAEDLRSETIKNAAVAVVNPK